MEKFDKCKLCNFGTQKDDCYIIGCENYDSFSPITNQTYLNRNTKKMAELLVEIVDVDGETEFHTMDGMKFYNFEEAINHTQKWLKSAIDMEIFGC